MLAAAVDSAVDIVVVIDDDDDGVPVLAVDVVVDVGGAAAAAESCALVVDAAVVVVVEAALDVLDGAVLVGADGKLLAAEAMNAVVVDLGDGRLVDAYDLQQQQ